MAFWNRFKGKKNSCEIDLFNKDTKYNSLKITLKEGRNRKIKIITCLIGYKVLDLKRVSFANISLVNLKEGDWELVEFNKIKNLK